mgnify:CR=1 FL=1
MTRHVIDDRKETLDASVLARFDRARAKEEGKIAPQTDALRKQPRTATPGRAARFVRINRGGDA